MTLKDGRIFELSNSNDVDHGNRGIVIHTLGIGDFELAFMQNLAHRSGGNFINLGK